MIKLGVSEKRGTIIFVFILSTLKMDACDFSSSELNLAGTENKLWSIFSQIKPIISSTFSTFLAGNQVCIFRFCQ